MTLTYTTVDMSQNLGNAFYNVSNSENWIFVLILILYFDEQYTLFDFILIN